MPAVPSTSVDTAPITRRRPSRALLVRLAVVLAVTPAIACGAALMLRADIGVGPIDMATLALADQLGVAVGSASWLLAGTLMVAALLLGVRPGLGTVAGFVVFGPALTSAYEALPTSSGVVAVASFGGGLVVAATGVALVVAADVGIGPPEALMIAVATRLRRPIGPVRIAQDLAVATFGMALGTWPGFGTVAVALGFGPLVAWLRPTLTGHVQRWAPRPSS